MSRRVNKSSLQMILGCLVLTSALSATAEPIDLDRYTSITKSGGSASKTEKAVMYAFRSHSNCKIWKYLPAMQMASGPLMQTTAITSAKVGSQRLRVAVTEVQMTSSNGITDELLERMKAKIAEELRASTDSCADSKATAANISLSPELVFSTQTSLKKKTSKGAVLYKSLSSGTISSNPGTYSDPMNQGDVLLNMDASSKDTLPYLQQLIARSKAGPVIVGTLNYNVEGVLNTLESHLTMSGKFSADWDSHLSQQVCNVTTEGIGLSQSAAFTAVAMNGLSLNSSTTKCSTNLVTEMSNGDYGVSAQISHSNAKLSVDGINLKITTCDEKQSCVTIPLADFVETQLWTLLLKANYEAQIKDLGNNVFEVKLGRSGKSQANFVVDAKYLRRFDGYLGLDIPVFAENLPASDFNLDGLTSPMMKCAQENYYEQSNTFEAHTGLTPMPVSAKCFPAKGN